MLETTYTVSVNRKVLMTEGWISDNEWIEGPFDRQSIIPGFDQGKLSSAKIGIIGCGGLGTMYSMLIARSGVTHQEICDDDFFELSNLNRQLGNPDILGENKALAWLDVLKGHCTAPSTLIAYPLGFPNVLDSYPEAYSSVDVIAVLVDNHQAKYEASAFGVDHNIPVIYSAISRDMKCGSAHIQEPGGPCFGCFKPPSNVTNAGKAEQCIDPAVIDIHAIMVGIVMRATLSIVMDWERPWNYFYFHTDGKGYSGKSSKNEDCEICGGV